MLDGERGPSSTKTPSAIFWRADVQLNRRLAYKYSNDQQESPLVEVTCTRAPGFNALCQLSLCVVSNL